MSLSDYLKCPGRTVEPVPKVYPCPDCGNPVEIWTDENKRKCPGCSAVIQNRNRTSSDEKDEKQDQQQGKTNEDLKILVQSAMRLSYFIG